MYVIMTVYTSKSIQSQRRLDTKLVSLSPIQVPTITCYRVLAKLSWQFVCLSFALCTAVTMKLNEGDLSQTPFVPLCHL